MGASGAIASLVMAGLTLVPTANSGAAAGPLVIGFECACTGPYASSLAIAAPVYQAWAKYVNAHGGVNGQQVQVVVKDDGDNPGTALANVQSLVTQNHAIAIVDNTNVDSGWATFVQQQGIPVIGAITSSTEMYTSPNFFPEGQTQNSVITGMVYAAQKVGGKKLALLYCAEATICQETVAPLKSAAGALKIQLVYNTAITFDAPNYTAPCLAAKQAGADTLWIAQGVQATLSAGNSCAQQSWFPKQLVDDGGLSSAFTQSSAFNNSTISIQPNIPFPVKSVPAMRTMYKALAKYAPSALTPANLDEEVPQAWASGIMLQTAAKLGGTGTVTSASLLNGLHKFNKQTLQGLAPPLTFNTPQHQVNCWFYLTIKGGKFATPYGLKAVCKKPLG